MNCLGNSFVMLRCCKFIEKYLDDEAIYLGYENYLTIHYLVLPVPERNDSYEGPFMSCSIVKH